MSEHTCEVHEEPVIAAIIYDETTTVGEGGCVECIRCTDCDLPESVVVDANYKEPYCRSCANRYSGEDTIIGLRIVRLDSPEYQEISTYRGWSQWKDGT